LRLNTRPPVPEASMLTTRPPVPEASMLTTRPPVPEASMLTTRSPKLLLRRRMEFVTHKQW
jgi:hypothetical protein